MSRPKVVPRAPVRRVRNVASVVVDHAVPDDWAHAWVARLLENAPAQRSGGLQHAPASSWGLVLMRDPAYAVRLPAGRKGRCAGRADCAVRGGAASGGRHHRGGRGGPGRRPSGRPTACSSALTGPSALPSVLAGRGVQGQPTLAIGLHLSGIPAAVLNHVRQTHFPLE